MRKNIFLFFLVIIGCSVKSDRIIQSALSNKNSEKALQSLDRAFDNTTVSSEKLKYILAIETLIKKKIKKADYYKAILKKKIIYLNDDRKKNKALLTLSKLFIQNYKNNIEALHYLEKIKIDALDEEGREQFFKSVLIAHINNKNYEQTLIEADRFLKRKDLSPSEQFRVKVLKARAHADFKKAELAEKQYIELLNKHPNLSKKWKIRTQLALTLEGQKKYKEAVKQLKLYSAQEKIKDPLLEWRIEEVSKRLIQQPGGKGRLRR